jgi:hypothetical protein
MEKVVPKKMLSPNQAGEMFSVSPGTLANWRSLKKGPRFYKVNRKILYKLEDLEDFFTSNPILTDASLPEGKQ